MTRADLDSMVDDRRWLLDKQPPWLNPITEWDFADSPERVIEFNRFVRAKKPGWFFDDIPLGQTSIWSSAASITRTTTLSID